MPPLWGLSERTAVYFFRYPRDRFVLDEIPEGKARLIACASGAFAHTPNYWPYKPDMCARHAPS